ncbi:MAG: glycerate kinase [Verrucomicrobia bacterium]|nr:glycerate kinase [Verrucomicrobiota bacterium]
MKPTRQRRRPVATPPAPLRVLVCPDKFKGTLTATAAAEAIAAGWQQARPGDSIELLPISDGGDGFGELVARHWGAEERVAETVDAAHRPVRAVWWWDPRHRTAIVESARVVGLAMLPAGAFHPFDLDTYGLGLLLRRIRELKPSWWVIGLGGSATNDAGFGLARALGWRFLDDRGAEIERWPELIRLRSVVGYSLRFPGQATFAVDVRNPLLGRRGATRVYGPQKGIRPEDVAAAEAAHARLVKVMTDDRRGCGFLAARPGAGAAGGLGFGLSVFFGGALENGFELYADWLKLAPRIAAADLVITGEGAIDETSLSMGKGVGGVARMCRWSRRPCLGLAGVVLDAAKAGQQFTAVHAIAPDLTSADESRRDAARWLTELARRVARAWR